MTIDHGIVHQKVGEQHISLKFNSCVVASDLIKAELSK